MFKEVIPNGVLKEEEEVTGEEGREERATKAVWCSEGVTGGHRGSRGENKGTA